MFRIALHFEGIAPLAAEQFNCRFIGRKFVRGQQIDRFYFLQRALAVEEGWDVDTLEEHIHAIEHVLYPEVVQMLADGRVHVLESGKVAIDAPRG